MECITEFMRNLNIFTLWKEYPVDFTHTFQKENGDCFMNTIDHILTLTRSRSNVVDAGVIHRVENMSDHEPIYAVIEVEHEPCWSKSQAKTLVERCNI